jgi:hypothetical protein
MLRDCRVKQRQTNDAPRVLSVTIAKRCRRGAKLLATDE